MTGSLGRGLIGIFLLFGCWDLTVRSGLVDARLFPSPVAVFQALLELYHEGVLVQDILATLVRVLLGYGVGAALGIVVGVITGHWNRVGAFLNPVLQLFRPIPAVSLVPLAIVWFGIGEAPKYFVISWASFFPVWVNTHVGIQKLPRKLSWTARIFRVQERRFILEVALPWAAPFIYAGARIALAFAFSATVVAEMSGAQAGLGFRILASHQVSAVGRMIADIIMIATLGFVADCIFVGVVKRLVPWATVKT